MFRNTITAAVPEYANDMAETIFMTFYSIKPYPQKGYKGISYYGKVQRKSTFTE